MLKGKTSKHLTKDSQPSSLYNDNNEYLSVRDVLSRSRAEVAETNLERPHRLQSHRQVPQVTALHTQEQSSVPFQSNHKLPTKPKPPRFAKKQQQLEISSH